MQVYIPRALIQPQLAAGVVRITFAQLRAATPGIFFHAEIAPPGAKVILPLECVLRQMMPSRRDNQRQPAIPVSIPSIFVKATQGSPVRGSAEPWYSQRRPTYDAEPRAAPQSKSASAPITHATKPSQPLASDRPRRSPRPPEQASAQPDHCAIPLAIVLTALPEAIRHALHGSDTQSASFLIPSVEMEARMRAGKLQFKWAQLRGWCSVELSALVAPETDIDLPLATVVPLFLATRGTKASRFQPAPDPRIPDIFSKSRRSTSSPLPAPPASPAQPVAVASPPLRKPDHVPAGAPAQIIERIRALDGVAGAFLATSDGLLIAGDVPHANENILAAFAPTAFAQLTRYADMAHLDLPESVDIHLVNGVTVHVRKTGKLYLGVLMPRDRSLPTHDLDRIATALSPQTS